MIGYKVNGNSVVETATGHDVYNSDSSKKNTEVCRHLNFGGGFDGWTPEFFLIPIPDEKNICTGTQFAYK